MLSHLHFEPLRIAKDGHSQTILADLLPSSKLRDLGRRWVIRTHDGDQLVCRVHPGRSSFLFLICHGLTGDSDAGYIHRLARHLLSLGHGVCRMNHRNCGEGMGLAKGAYHSGRSEDIGRIVHELKSAFPSKKIVCVGYSMSGNASLLLAAQHFPNLEPDQEVHPPISQPDFLIAINPPVNLSKTSDQFMIRLNRLYQWNFVRGFRRLLKELHKSHLLDETYKIRPLMSIREFDDLYTSTRSGFGDAETYYKNCSAITRLKAITVPTMILTTKDDPIIQYSHLEQAEKSSAVRVHVENHGGHMGFLSSHKTQLGDHRWMDYAVLEIFKEMIK